MSDESIQATAENLRADFLNATTTHQRWKVLNRAIDWAVAASENAEAHRQKAWVRHSERVLSDGERAIRGGDIVTVDGKEGLWVVTGFPEAPLVDLVPVQEDYAFARYRTRAENLQ